MGSGQVNGCGGAVRRRAGCTTCWRGGSREEQGEGGVGVVRVRE